MRPVTTSGEALGGLTHGLRWPRLAGALHDREPDNRPSLVEDGEKGNCELCEYKKMTWKTIQKECQDPRAEKFGDEIHSDLWGLFNVLTLGNQMYYITFMDNFMQYTHLKLL